MANVQGMNDAGTSIQDWFRSVPMVTKILVFGTLSMTVVSNFGMYAADNMYFDINAVWNKFEIQRLVLPFFYAGSFSFNYAMHLYVLYENCNRYEASPFNTGAGGSSADFLWMVIFGMVTLNFLNYFLFEFPFLSEPLLYMIMYVWSRRAADQQLKVFGFGPFKAVYLPWVYMVIRLIMGGSITGMVIGAVVGHAYYFFYEVMPQVYPSFNIARFGTPAFCRSFSEWFTGMSVPRAAPPPGTAAAAGFAQQRTASLGTEATAPRAGGNTMTGGYNWGRGRTLGTAQ